jgi:hypothetical protein
MAERLESFRFFGKRTRKYPMAEWMDGSIWKLRRGEDFTCVPRYLIGRLKEEAKQHDYALNLANPVDGDMDVIVFQFVKRDTKERLIDSIRNSVQQSLRE